MSEIEEQPEQPEETEEVKQEIQVEKEEVGQQQATGTKEVPMESSEKLKDENDTKKKKINRMSIEEIEVVLEKTRKHMGGLGSRYARSLIGRKAILMEKDS